jgi:hypothetical protein
VPEAVGSHGKLHRHEFEVILPKPGYRRSRIIGIREDALVGVLGQDYRQEIVDQDPLVVPSDLPAGFLEADVLVPPLGQDGRG